MDVAKDPSEIAKRRRRRVLVAAVSVIVCVAAVYGASRLGRAAPTMDTSGLWIDTVKEGPLVRDVRGVGELVPDDDASRWMAAELEGRIDRKFVEAGAQVTSSTVVLQMSNPDVEQAAVAADLALGAAKAALTGLDASLQNDLLALRSAVAAVEADQAQAAIQADVDSQLAKDGLLSEVTSKQSRVRADSLATRVRLERDRIATTERSVETRLAVQRAEVENRQTVAALKRRDVDALTVRAGMAGVLQEVVVSVGQRVTRSANLARVVDPKRLKALLRIPDAQTNDLHIGLSVDVDTRGAIVPGRLSRLAPAAQNGTVTVDVELLGELPPGARPDMTVDGMIELERLDHVRHIPRPMALPAGAAAVLFKVSPDGSRAERVGVRFGRSSASEVEIVEGDLRPGDRVVLSDTAAWRGHESVRLR